MCIGLLFATDCASEQDSVKSEMEKFQGTWPLVYQQTDGKKVPDEKAAEMLHGKMVFARDKIHYSVELQGFDFQLAYKLHPDQQPKGIDLTLTETLDGRGVGQTMLGIYRFEGATLEICHNKTNRPTDFSAGERSHNVLIVLKRALE